MRWIGLNGRYLLETMKPLDSSNSVLLVSLRRLDELSILGNVQERLLEHGKTVSQITLPSPFAQSSEGG